jgi:anti-sigma B factor antagonist
MAARPLEAVVDGGPELARVVLSGQIDRDADAAMAGAYERAAALGASAVELDFDDVDYINSTGIALIVRFLADARRDRREIRARGLTEHYREIFRITRLADFMTMLDETPVSAASDGGRT